MSDITMCANNSCSIKQSCERYLAHPSERQSYANFVEKDGECEDYYER